MTEAKPESLEAQIKALFEDDGMFVNMHPELCRQIVDLVHKAGVALNSWGS